MLAYVYLHIHTVPCIGPVMCRHGCILNHGEATCNDHARISINVPVSYLLD